MICVEHIDVEYCVKNLCIKKRVDFIAQKIKQGSEFSCKMAHIHIYTLRYISKCLSSASTCQRVN